MNFDFDQVFITGSNGWLGRMLTRSFFVDDEQCIVVSKKNNLDVFCFIHHSENGSYLQSISPSIQISKGDITQRQDCQAFISRAKEGKKLLVHTAGIIHPQKIKDFYQVNVQGTRDMVDSAIAQNFDKIIVISSNSPCGNNTGVNEKFTEQSPYNPYMHYGKSKMQMELYLQRKIAENANISIIRPPWFYGESMPDRQLLFYNMIIKGQFPIVGSGDNVRSIANVKNIVQGIILAAIKPESKGQTYWIADEHSPSMNEMISTIQKVFEQEFNVSCKPNKVKLPYIVGQVAELVDKLLQFVGIYVQKIHVLSEMNKTIACDISKARQELGYSPKIDLYQGTSAAYHEYLANNNEK